MLIARDIPDVSAGIALVTIPVRRDSAPLVAGRTDHPDRVLRHGALDAPNDRAEMIDFGLHRADPPRSDRLLMLQTFDFLAANVEFAPQLRDRGSVRASRFTCEFARH